MARTNNIIVFDNGAVAEYPILAQAASPELSAEERAISLNILFEALRYLKKNTNNIPIDIIYLPSVASTYRWRNPVQVQTYFSEKNMFISDEDNKKHSLMMRQQIWEFSRRFGFGFVDATEAVRKAGGKYYLHGNKDPKHFNVQGYKLVSDVMTEASQRSQ